MPDFNDRKILVSMPEAWIESNYQLNPLLTILGQNDCRIDYVEGGNFDQAEQYDVILVATKDGLSFVEEYARNGRVPICYFYSDIERDFVWNSSAIVMNMMYGNSPSDLPQVIAGHKDYSTLPIFLEKDCFVGKEAEHTEIRAPIDLLICVDERTLRTLVPGINHAQYYRITVISGNKNKFENLMNTNVSVVSCRNARIEQYIEKSDIFIGNGWKAAMAISKSKPTLIVGDKGYGGILDMRSIDRQADMNFRGRIGGTLHEFIPTELVFNDVDACAGKLSAPAYIESLTALCSYYADRNASNLKSMSEKILNIASQNHSRREPHLILNEYFVLKKVSDNKHLIIDKTINKYVAVVTDQEFEIINLFKQQRSIEQAFEMVCGISEIEFNEFVEELRTENILRLWI